MKNNLPYIVNKNLKIEIYVIGYKTIGESIVLFIRVDSNIVFSAVIDSYFYLGINKTVEILEKNNVDKINYLCWSHPDEDHSKGIDELINKYVDKNTVINIPENVEINKNECSKETIQIFNLLKNNLNIRKDRKYRVYTISDFKDILAYEEDLRILYNEKEYVLEIKSIAPNSNLIRDELLLENFSKNKHSIAFLFYFGNLIFLFSGDIENPTIKLFSKKKIPENLNFLKIPHHGSNSSNYLLDFIKNIDVSCVTSYIRGSSKNPRKSILSRYQEISTHVYSSYNLVGDNDNDFGIICTTFDIIDDSYEIELIGNACEYICN